MKAGSNILVGIAVGDALGVPYEFSSREQMKVEPATDMVGYKTHNQPPGTWSDDSSLTFCLAEALLSGAKLADAASSFVRWRNEAYWTPYNYLFDIGITTATSINKLEEILKKGSLEDLLLLKYGSDERENGNGSLMRILPLVFELKGMQPEEKFKVVWDYSSLTHGHIRAAMCCFSYLTLAEHLLSGISLNEGYETMRSEVQKLWERMDFAQNEREHFGRFIQGDIRLVSESEIRSGGYVIDSIEASLWSLLTSSSYTQAVLKSINLGDDTDTAGAITGGLAGLYYTAKEIPKPWIESLARLEDILSLGSELDKKYCA